ncbi:hypothetical protein [Deinococcus geothermalis]|uniref:hypothetical protein n=1 Tax=Deinococcus geothermalis TaxID=68909 RepID=UPI002357D2EF|nr:hypothetical protein [Deinococcus geothermalis]
MKTASARKVAALVFALFVAGGSLASAGGAADYGMCKVTKTNPVPNGGAADYGM